MTTASARVIQTPGETSSQAGCGKVAARLLHASVVGRVDRLLVRQPARHAARDAQRPQRDDERRHAQAGDQRAVDRPGQRRRRSDGGQDGERRAATWRVEQQRDDHAGQGQHGADRQVNAAADDDQRHPQRAQAGDDGLGGDRPEVVQAQEGRAGSRTGWRTG